MPLETAFISGPGQSGKTTLAHMVADHLLARPGHYIRMTPARDGYTNTVVAHEPGESPSLDGHWASIHTVTYTPDRIFETLPDGLRAVRQIDRRGFTLIEADADPCLRHAYPYDYRIFVMPAPADVYEVFRPPQAAAEALQQVMQDTAAFASEIFGLFDAAGLDDTAGVHHVIPAITTDREEPVEELDIDESQIRQFVNSPIGAEIASRIQLQPAYHGLVESDVVVINTGLGRAEASLDQCISRLEKLLGRLRHDTRRHSVLYWGDIQDISDPAHHKLCRRLRALFAL